MIYMYDIIPYDIIPYIQSCYFMVHRGSGELTVFSPTPVSYTHLDVYKRQQYTPTQTIRLPKQLIYCVIVNTMNSSCEISFHYKKILSLCLD